MEAQYQGSYLENELDPKLLASPFEVQTSWYVITGAPCSGKTTLIDLLAGRGYTTAVETAREYFDIEMRKGRTSQQIRDCGKQTQKAIFEMQKRLERSLQPDEIVFLDRALPDSLTFNRLFGLDPGEILPECFKNRYAGVFILERLPFEREVQLGPEEEKPAQFIDLWLERDYTSLGYQVVRVPVYSPKERLEFVQSQIAEFDRGLTRSSVSFFLEVRAGFID
jgi:predicted ATPase